MASFEITDRGRLVARLVPIARDPWKDRVNASEVTLAARPLTIDDLKPAAYAHNASENRKRLRRDER